MKVAKNQRKIDRKEQRNKKKQLKHLNYLKHKSKKHDAKIVTGVSKTKADNVWQNNNSKVLPGKGKADAKLNALKQIIADAKSEMKIKSNNKKIEKQDSSKECSGGLIFANSNNANARMAALQEFVNNETKSAAGCSPGKSKLKKKSIPNSLTNVKKSKLAMINDKHKLKELEEGMKRDTLEINYMQRQLKYNAKQKKSVKVFRNCFGSDIGDIFDALESEPSEADLLSEQKIFNSEISIKKKKKVDIPKNAITVATLEKSFEQDEADSDENFTFDSDIPVEIPVSILNNRKRKSVPVLYEYEGIESDDEVNESIAVDQPHNPIKLKSIMKNKMLRKKKKARLSVSFDLGKNAIKEIPLVSKISGFTVYDTSDIIPLTEKCSKSDATSAIKNTKTVDMEQDMRDEEWTSDSECESDSFLNGDESTGDVDEDDIDMEVEFTDSEDLDDSEDDEDSSEVKELGIQKKEKLLDNGFELPEGELTEDIYGQLRDSSGNVVNRKTINGNITGDQGKYSN